MCLLPDTIPIIWNGLNWLKTEQPIIAARDLMTTGSVMKSTDQMETDQQKANGVLKAVGKSVGKWGANVLVLVPTCYRFLYLDFG